MKIAGLQKLTLLDYPGKLAAILFLDGCNFRCPFCQNSSLVLPGETPILPESAVLDFLRKRAGVLDGVCISGGEPTLYPDLPDLIRKIRGLGYLVKLDTNGTNPALLRSLTEEGLIDYAAMDIKTGRANYAAVSGCPDSASLLERVERSAAFLMSGALPYEFRTTVVRGLHTDADFEDMSLWLKGCQNYYLQSFRDCDSILQPDHSFTAFSDEEMLAFLHIMQKTIPHAKIRGMDA